MSLRVMFFLMPIVLFSSFVCAEKKPNPTIEQTIDFIHEKINGFSSVYSKDFIVSIDQNRDLLYISRLAKQHDTNKYLRKTVTIPIRDFNARALKSGDRIIISCGCKNFNTGVENRNYWRAWTASPGWDTYPDYYTRCDFKDYPKCLYDENDGRWRDVFGIVISPNPRDSLKVVRAFNHLAKRYREDMKKMESDDLF